MVVVLWLSRHKPLPIQIKFLKEKLGKDTIIVEYSEPISTAEKAVELIKQFSAKYVVPVLPLSFIIHLVQESKKHGFIVLRAEMELLHNCESEKCPEYNPNTDSIVVSKDLQTSERIFRHFRFKEFVQLVDIQIVTKPLD